MKIEGEKYTNPKFLTCGMYLFKPHPYIGAAPDNLLKYDCCPKSFVEYKCPYAIRIEKLTESWQKCDFLEQVNGKIQLKRNRRYYSQIIGEMAITGHYNAYFVVFISHNILINCVKFDGSYCQKIFPNFS